MQHKDYQVLKIRGVYQIAQTAETAKTAIKSPAKWHNRTVPQITVHHTA